MKKMHLRTTLSLCFGLIVALTVLLVSILSGIFISRQFEDYVKKSQKEQAANIAESIGSNYEEESGFNIDYVHGMGMYALKDGYILKLYDLDGNVLWDAQNHDMALCHEIMDSIVTNMKAQMPEVQGEFITYTYNLESEGSLKGILEISYYTPYYLDENGFEFIRALNTILLVVGAIALLTSLVLGVMFAKRITMPMSGVIAATGKIASGDYSVRVDTGLNEVETYELAESVNHMADSLEKQDSLRKQMTGDIAHELRTPVTNISSYMEMMLEEVMEPSKEHLQSCYDELKRLSSLIGDLERLESVESADYELDKEDVELYSLSENILRSFDTKLKEKNIKAKLTGNETTIYADKGRISQVIANLLSNAVKYTDEEGHITVSVKEDSDKALIIVEDDGIGIPKDERELVFERFYRTDKSRTRKTGGAGIGLSITKAIVKAHQGSIRCEEGNSGGSRFIVEIPKQQV